MCGSDKSSCHISKGNECVYKYITKSSNVIRYTPCGGVRAASCRESTKTDLQHRSPREAAKYAHNS